MLSEIHDHRGRRGELLGSAGCSRRPSAPRPAPSLPTIAAPWGRIGLTGFGGPPTHIALLRRLVVDERPLDRAAGLRGCRRRLQPASGARIHAAVHLLRPAPCRRRSPYVPLDDLRSVPECGRVGPGSGCRRSACAAVPRRAGPAAIGAILGSAIPLARALPEGWQFGLLAAAAMALLGGPARDRADAGRRRRRRRDRRARRRPAGALSRPGPSNLQLKDPSCSCYRAVKQCRPSSSSTPAAVRAPSRRGNRRDPAEAGLSVAGL